MKNKTKYAIAVGDYSYSYITDPQFAPMTWVERFDTLAEACAEMNDIYTDQHDLDHESYDYELTIIEETEIDHELARSCCGDDYRENSPTYEQLEQPSKPNQIKKHDWIDEINPAMIKLISLANEALSESIENERGQLSMAIDWQVQVIQEELKKLREKNPIQQGEHLVQAIIDQI